MFRLFSFFQPSSHPAPNLAAQYSTGVSGRAPALTTASAVRVMVIRDQGGEGGGVAMPLGLDLILRYLAVLLKTAGPSEFSPSALLCQNIIYGRVM